MYMKWIWKNTCACAEGTKLNEWKLYVFLTAPFVGKRMTGTNWFEWSWSLSQHLPFFRKRTISDWNKTMNWKWNSNRTNSDCIMLLLLQSTRTSHWRRWALFRCWCNDIILVTRCVYVSWIGPLFMFQWIECLDKWTMIVWRFGQRFSWVLCMCISTTQLIRMWPYQFLLAE